ncbi:putative SNAP25 homologous protein SNAP30 [Apium graveolens]|uniref:putative SNAP25 homologous protein SNAP30 n=1 Tax=Apium graveolens TaxID=4045 RepID=UPI003D7B1D43
MFGFKKSHKNSEAPQGMTKDRRTSSEPASPTGNNKHKSKEELDSMSVQELEGYAVDKSKETTDSVYNSVRIAQEIRGTASQTLDTLHQQGEQIHRTHAMAAETEKDLAKGEKVLGNLGGMFSRTWKPKKGKKIDGPAPVSKDDNNYQSKKKRKEEREKLGIAPKAKGKGSHTPPPESSDTMQQIENEKTKQDDGLDMLSDILGDLKGMAVDMGTEIEKQNKALDHFSDDVDELNNRVKGANQRTRKLLNK